MPAVAVSGLAARPGALVFDGLGQPVGFGRGATAGSPWRPRLDGVSDPARRAPASHPAGPPEPGPERAPDDSDVGWGERPADVGDDDRRYLEDRPPHWGSD
jgi:hypothetical protein